MPDRPVRVIIEDQKPVTATADMSVAAAARLMKENHIGALLVVDHGRLSGIFTERDALFRVIADGLDLDFRREPFGPMRALLSRADAVTTLTAICETCGAPAELTQRTVNGVPAPHEDPVVVLDLEASYEARCVTCYEAERARSLVAG